MTPDDSRGGARRRVFTAALLLLLCAPGAACRTSADRGDARPLAHTFDSPSAAAAAVADALARKDLEALRTLTLSEHEFRTIVWPELPSSRPEVNLPVAYAWGTLQQTSQNSLGTTFSTHGGRRYTVVGVEFAGGTTRYESFAVHRKAQMLVRGEDGAEQRLALFGSLLEREGRFKIFSYVTD